MAEQTRWGPRRRYRTVYRKKAEALQITLVLSGFCANLKKDTARGRVMWEVVITGAARPNRRAGFHRKTYRKTSDNTVYCVTVPSGHVMVRRAGKVTITHNSGNFGLVYKMQPKGFQAYARATYGVGMGLDEATAFRDLFFSRRPGLTRWHAAVIRSAKSHGYIRSVLGRIRRVPQINSSDWVIRAKQERQAINAGIQSVLSDMLLLAMVEVDKRYPGLWQFGMIHDQLVAYVPTDELPLWADRIREVMENLPFGRFGWNPALTFPVDIEAGIDLASMRAL